MHNILFISYDGLTDPLGQSQILPYIFGLTRFGYHFTILSAEKEQRFRQHKHKIEGLIKNYPVRWEPVMYHKKPPVLSSVYDYRNMLTTAIRLHRQTPFSLVHTRPGIPTLVALRLKKRFGIKFLNDVRGFWADERVDGQLWNLNNPLYKTVYTFFKRHEAECLRVNDYTTCLTQSARREMNTWNLLKNKEQVEVIPCSVDLDLFDPLKIRAVQQQQLRQALHIAADDFVISYLGSTGTWYMMDEMFRFFSLLKKKIQRLKILFISPAIEHERIKSFVHKYGLNAAGVIIRELDRKEVPLHLSLCHYSVFFIKPCFSKISSSPTKHGEIMAMGIPVISNSGVGDVKEIITESRSGFVIEHFSDAEYNATIEKMLSANFDPDVIREAAKKYYSLNNAVQQYSNVYRALLPWAV